MDLRALTKMFTELADWAAERIRANSATVADQKKGATSPESDCSVVGGTASATHEPTTASDKPSMPSQGILLLAAPIGLATFPMFQYVLPTLNSDVVGVPLSSATVLGVVLVTIAVVAIHAWRHRYQRAVGITLLATTILVGGWVCLPPMGKRSEPASNSAGVAPEEPHEQEDEDEDVGDEGTTTTSTATTIEDGDNQSESTPRESDPADQPQTTEAPTGEDVRPEPTSPPPASTTPPDGVLSMSLPETEPNPDGIARVSGHISGPHASIQVGDRITVRTTLRNSGSQAVQIDSTFIATRILRTNTNGKFGDRVVNLTLNPGETTEVTATWQPGEPEIWLLWPCYNLPDGGMCPNTWEAVELPVN